MDFFLKTVPETSASQSAMQRLSATVHNTGNYFFECALNRQLSGVKTISCIDEFPRGEDRLILSMSNFVSPATDLGWFADQIISVSPKQIVMIGAGAQAESYSEKISLTPGTKRFVDLISSLSVTIGVRGQYTAEVLSSLGVKNVDVIGCPSLFYNCRRDFSIDKKHLNGRVPRPVVHCTPSGYYRDAISHLLSFAVREGASYIAQSESFLIYENPEGESDRDFFFGYYNDGSYSKDFLYAWMKENVKWFFDIDSWFDYMKNIDLSVGARFHGNMAALQVGVPALNLVFDTRTRELCEFLNLPYDFLGDFDWSKSSSEIYDDLDYSVFNAGYASRFDGYVQFLNKNGVPHRLEDVGLNRDPQFLKIASASIVDLLTSLGETACLDSVFKEMVRRVNPGRSSALRKMAEAGLYDSRTKLGD